MRPDNAIFHQHILGADFQVGFDDGSWGMYSENLEYTEWPLVILWVRALQKEGAPDKYYFRFDLAGYPNTAPTACPWDITTNSRLENHLWPKGNRLVSFTFNYGWNPCALYVPCDRLAMQGHDGWREQYPELWWEATFKITVYLQFIHRLLNSSDYAKS